jgi:hypothetical protein
MDYERRLIRRWRACSAQESGNNNQGRIRIFGFDLSSSQYVT